MLLKFRVSELSRLLQTFHYPISDNALTLRYRAIDLLRNKPRNLDYQAYLNKIVDIYKSMLQTRSQHTRTNQYRQPQQYLLQLTYTPRAGLPQVIPPVPIGIYTNNGGNYIFTSNNIQNSNQLTGFRDKVPRITHSTQQTVAIANNANLFIPSFRFLAYVNFKKNPFVEIIAEIIKISALVGHNKCSTQNPSQGIYFNLIYILLFMLLPM